MFVARSSCGRVAGAVTVRCRLKLVHHGVCSRASFHISHHRSANESATYPPPFNAPPFSVPPPTPNPPPVRQPTSRSARRFQLICVTFLAGLGIGYVYWQRNNGGFPLDVMKHVRSAEKLIRDADALNDSPATEPQRQKLLTQAEEALSTALKQTNTPSPLAAKADKSSTSALPLFIDPALPPHILALMGSVCQLQGEGRWQAAEQCYLAALRQLVEYRKVEESRLKKASGGIKNSAAAADSEVLEYLDGRMLSVGRQLGGLYTAMRSDVAAEAVLLRSLQLLSEVRLKQQQKSSSKSITEQSKSTPGSVKESVHHTVEPSEYDDDVTAELSEQLSTVFRLRGDYSQAIMWTGNALKMNDKAANASQQTVTSDAPKDDMSLQRKRRELHLFTALCSDYFSLYLASSSVAESFHSPTTASPLENAYHASIHALEALQPLVDSTAAQPTSSSSSNKRKTPTSSATVLVTPTPRHSRTTSPPVTHPPMRSQSVNLVPSTSHQRFLAKQAADRLFRLPPSTQRFDVFVEAVAAYSNLASVLSARGEEGEAEVAWDVAERAARVLGEKEYMDVIDEQKRMLRSESSGQ